MEYALGIDLGTTNSCVALVEHGKPIIIANKSGYKTTPSIVAITESGKRLIGQLAKRQAVTNATNTVFSTKRLIGRSIDDPEVQQCMDTLPYEIVEGPHGDVRVMMKGSAYALSEIAAMILSELRQVAEEYTGQRIDKAIITVPAYFDDAQRQATIDAGHIAGLDVLRIINEPTAAAIAYGCKQTGRLIAAVYDLGGGTFDISILSIEDGVFNVLSTTGDTFLGGEDFDNRIIEYLVMSFARQHGIDLRDDPMAMQRLKIAAEKAKCDLTSLTATEINLPFIRMSSGGDAMHINVVLTREDFDELVVDLVKRTLKISQIALMQANMTPDDIDEVVLVGGMTRVPIVQLAVTEFFKKPPARSLNPDEAVAIGAAIQANALVNQVHDHILLDVTPLDLGIAVHGGKFHVIIPRNTTIPCSNAVVFTTSFDNQTSLRIVVLQGEKENESHNQILSEFTFSGIAPAPAGSVDVEITFDIDADGIVSVSARDLATRQIHAVTVERSSKLTANEIDRMMQANAEYLVAEKIDNEARIAHALLHESTAELEEHLSHALLPCEVSDQAADILKKAKSALEHPNQLTDIKRAIVDVKHAISYIQSSTLS